MLFGSSVVMDHSGNKERLLELYGDSHPGFGSYLECMTRTNFTGIATFTIAFSCSYLTQNLLKNKLPYSNKFFILTSTLISGLVAYKVAKSRSAICQAAWLASEDKITYFTEIENSKNTDK